MKSISYRLMSCCSACLLAISLLIIAPGKGGAPAAAQLACDPPPPGMVSWWPGDGNANDIQNGNNGTLQGGATFAPGEVGQAFQFSGSGSGQFVQVGNIPSLSFERTNAFSIDAWIRTSETVHDIFIASKQPNTSPFKGYGLLIGNGEVPQCDASNPTAAGAGQLAGVLDGQVSNSCPPDFDISVRGTTHLNDGQWHHVAMTYDGSSSASGLKLYVDGAPETAVTQQNNLGTNTILNSAPFTIGSRENGGVSFNGNIDEVEVFNRALSAPEVAAIFGAGSAGKCKYVCTAPPSGMVSWWPGDGNANDIQDGNNGTLQNGATFASGLVGQAFSLDGSTGYVSIPASASLDVGSSAAGMSIDAWIFPTDNDVNPVVEWSTTTYGVHLWEGFGCLSPNCASRGPLPGALYANVVDTSGGFHGFSTQTAVVPIATWSHVALTYDKTTGNAALYVNGVAVQTSNLGVFTPRTNLQLNLGARPISDGGCTGNGCFFGGKLDEVEIFSRPLSLTEIQAIFNARTAGKCKSVGPSFNKCLRDDRTGNLLQWSSTTGEYKFTRCSDGFMLTGTGVTGLVNGICTLKDSKPDRRLNAGISTATLTGSATIYFMVAQGVWQVFRISDTNPNATCACNAG